MKILIQGYMKTRISRESITHISKNRNMDMKATERQTDEQTDRQRQTDTNSQKLAAFSRCALAPVI